MMRRRLIKSALLAPLASSGRTWAFGDSLTLGVGASSYERSWIGLLGFPVENRARGASLCEEQWLLSIRPILGHIRPVDRVIWLTGFNDMRRGNVETYTAALSEAVPHLPGLTLLTCLPLAGYDHRPFADAAERTGARVIRLSAVEIGPDGVHPTDAGYAALAAQVRWRAWLPEVRR